MSCCGGRCGCGSGCQCGSGCGGCKMYPDLMEKSTTMETLIIGVALEKKSFDGFEMDAGSIEGGCNCGSNCTYDPCNHK